MMRSVRCLTAGVVLLGILSSCLPTVEGSGQYRRRICVRFMQCSVRTCRRGYTLVQQQFWEYGRRCYDCGVCVRRGSRPDLQTCPNIPPCPALPANCPHTIPAPVIDFQGVPCLGCRRCAPICDDNACTALACTNPGPRAVVQRPGRPPCLGCESCLDILPPQPDCATANCISLPNQCPDTSRLILPPGECCPVCQENPPDCSAASCLSVSPPCSRIVTPRNGCCSFCEDPPNCGINTCLPPLTCPNTITSPGQCCPVCRDPPLPLPPCADNSDVCIPVREDCEIVLPGPETTFLGQACSGCTTCAVPQGCSAVPCPELPDDDCTLTFTPEGLCCKVCIAPCPALLCPMNPPACPVGFLIRPITVSNSRFCLGCEECNNGPQTSCPLLRCEPLPCRYPIATTFISNGRVCADCPRCPRGTNPRPHNRMY